MPHATTHHSHKWGRHLRLWALTLSILASSSAGFAGSENERSNDKDQFNERGYRKSSSYRRVTENERVSNFNGNLTYKQVLYSGDGVGAFDHEIALVYNGSASFVRFDSKSLTEPRLDRFTPNFYSAGAWFLSVDGYIVYPFLYSRGIINAHHPDLNTGNAYYRNGSRLLVGYAVADRGFGTTFPVETSDDLLVALEDGTAQTLLDTGISTPVPGESYSVGEFQSSDPGEYLRGRRIRLADCFGGNGPAGTLTVHAASGHRYSFDPVCYDISRRLSGYRTSFDDYDERPYGYRLRTIEDSFSNSVEVYYTNWDDDLTTSDRRFRAYNTYPRSVEIVTPHGRRFRIGLEDPTVRPETTVGSFYVALEEIEDNSVVSAWRFLVAPTTEPGAINRNVSFDLEQVECPEGRLWAFEYEQENRSFEYPLDGECSHAGDLNFYTVYGQRLREVHYPMGGHTRYTYLDECEDGECSPAQCHIGATEWAHLQHESWSDYGRSIHQSNVVKTVTRSLDDAPLSEAEKLEYTYGWEVGPTGVPFTDRLNEVRYRYKTDLETFYKNPLYNPDQPGEEPEWIETSSKELIFRKIPHDDTQHWTKGRDWFTRVETETVTDSDAYDWVTSNVYYADPTIPSETEGAHRGSFKLRERTRSLGGASYTESFSYDSNFHQLTQYIDPVGTTTETDHLNLEIESSGDYFLLADPVERRTVYDAFGYRFAEDYTEYNESVSPTGTLGRIQSRSKLVDTIHSVGEIWAVTEFFYEDSSYPYLPTRIVGPGGVTEKRYYDDYSLVDGTYTGHGLGPTRIELLRWAGDTTPLAIYADHDRSGLLRRWHDENGNIFRHEYDHLDRILSMSRRVGPDNYLPYHTYDYNETTSVDGVPSTVTVTSHRSGLDVDQAIHHIDGIDRLFRSVEGQENPRTTTRAYSYGDLVRSVTDPAGVTTETEFNRHNEPNLEKYISAGTEKEWTRSFTAVPPFSGSFGAVINAYSEDEDRKTIVTDAVGRTRVVEDDALATSTFDYDPLGRLTSFVDGDGIETSYYYDLAGRLTSLDHPDDDSKATVGVVAASLAGQPTDTHVRHFVPQSSSCDYSFTLLQSGSQSSTIRIYPELGGPDLLNLSSGAAPEASGSLSTLVPDQTYILEAVSLDGGLAAGWARFDSPSPQRRKVYDLRGNLRFEETPRLSADAGSSVWRYTKFDWLDRPLESGLLPPGQQEEFLKSVADSDYPSAPTGTVVLSELDYDAASYGGWTVYNGKGRVTRVRSYSEDGAFIETRLMSYDEDGRVSDEEVQYSLSTPLPTASMTVTFDYEYDRMGNLTRCQVFGGTGPPLDVYTGYNEHSEVHWVGPTPNEANAFVSYRYDRRGSLLNAYYANGVECRASWNSRGWLSSIDLLGSAGKQWEEGYIYYADGNLRFRGPIVGEYQNFGYDAASRLKSVVRGDEEDWSANYSAAGNRESVTRDDGTWDYDYEPGSHRLSSVTRVGGTGPDWQFGYTADGSMSFASFGTAATPPLRSRMSFISREYGPRERVRTLRTATADATQAQGLSDQITYYYDGAGREAVRQTSEGLTLYVRDAWGTTRGEFDQNGQPVAWWVSAGTGHASGLAGGGVNAGSKRQPVAVVTPSLEAVAYLHDDVHGSVRRVTDGTGELIALRDLMPFGEPLRSEIVQPDGPMESIAALRRALSVGFAGQRREPATEALRFEARRQWPSLGRFDAVDPMTLDVPGPEMIEEPQTLHPYSYAANNPNARIDPDGRLPKKLRQKDFVELGGSGRKGHKKATKHPKSAQGKAQNDGKKTDKSSDTKDSQVDRGSGDSEKPKLRAGQKVGGGGKPVSPTVRHSTRKRAQDAAQAETAKGKAPVHHKAQKGNPPHYHGVDSKGNAKPTHHDYPKP